MTSISVIIPTYNRAHSLARALDSVLAQTRPADEIIVIDDGSTDDTPELMEQHYSDLGYYYRENRGVSAARNTGIRKASGDWLAFLDSDDEWLPEKLQCQLQRINDNPSCRIVHNEEIWIRDGVRVNQMKKHQKYGGIIFDHCLPLCVISPSAVIIHRSVFDKVGLFDESLPACEDYDLWLRICALYPVEYIDEPLITKYGGHDDQLSRQFWGMDRFRIQSLSRILDSGVLTPPQQQAASTTLLEKCRIYIAGAEKRKRWEEVAHYTALIERYDCSDSRDTVNASST